MTGEGVVLLGADPGGWTTALAALDVPIAADPALAPAAVALVGGAPEERAALVAAALDDGRPVIAAAPVAASPADAARLIETAAARGLALLPALPGRWSPPVERLRDAVADGLLGRLAVLRIVRSAPLGALDGVGIERLVDDLDAASRIAGPPVRLSAVRRRAGAADALHVLLEHDGGAISTVLDVRGPEGAVDDLTLSATGDGGDLAHGSTTERGARAVLGGLPVDLPAEAADAAPSARMLRDLLAAAAGGTAARAVVADALAAVRLVDAVRRSIVDGGPVPVQHPEEP